MKRPFLILSITVIGLLSCKNKDLIQQENFKQYITILGTAQDGGYPHIGCQKTCCTSFYNGKNSKKNVVSLGLVDQENQQKWISETLCT